MNLTAEINELRNVAQHIAAKLEEFILNGTIPPGTRLIQTKVAEQFGVSRLPVRDAFAMLMKSELAIALPRKGIMVRPIHTKDIRDLFEVRRIIETAAIRKSAPALTPQDLAQARALIAAQAAIDPAVDFTGLLEADERFHSLLWSHHNNAEIDLVLTRVWNRIKLVRAQARGLPEWQKVSVTHHEQIVNAIEAKDFDEVVRLVESGIVRSEEELTSLVARTPQN
jgi:DNA-binding GntR family transcriptional regulator